MKRPKMSSWISDLARNDEKRRKIINNVGTKFSAKKKLKLVLDIQHCNIHDFHITYVLQFISCSQCYLTLTVSNFLLTHTYLSQGSWVMKSMHELVYNFKQPVPSSTREDGT